MAIEIGVQNAGLGASLALQHFTPGTAMVCATATITHTLIGAIYANLCQKLDQRRKRVYLPLFSIKTLKWYKNDRK